MIKYEHMGFKKSFDIKPPQLVPIHPKIQDDELFASWFCRLSIENQTSPLKILNWLREGRTFERLPSYITDDIIKDLSLRSGVSVDRLNTSRLTPNIEQINPIHRVPVILRMPGHFRLGAIGETKHTVRLYLEHGDPQFCPLCMKEALPYFRKSWFSNLVVVCEKHQIVLLEKCTHCGLPPYLEKSNEVGIGGCYKCGNSYENNQTEFKALPEVVLFQSSLSNIKSNDIIQVGLQRTRVRGTDYIHLANSLFKFVLNYRLYEFFDQNHEYVFTRTQTRDSHGRTQIERHDALNVVRWILADWSKNLMLICCVADACIPFKNRLSPNIKRQTQFFAWITHFITISAEGELIRKLPRLLYALEMKALEPQIIFEKEPFTLTDSQWNLIDSVIKIFQHRKNGFKRSVVERILTYLSNNSTESTNSSQLPDHTTMIHQLRVWRDQGVLGQILQIIYNLLSEQKYSLKRHVAIRYSKGKIRDDWRSRSADLLLSERTIDISMAANPSLHRLLIDIYIYPFLLLFDKSKF